MVLILSNPTDQTTNHVIDWMNFYGVKYYRTNGQIRSIEINIKSIEGVKIIFHDKENLTLDLKNISSFWYRRGDWFIFRPNLIKRLRKSVFNILDKEWNTIGELIHYYLDKKPNLGSIYDDKNHNKLLALTTAVSAGLLIPETYITTEKWKLVHFFKQVKSAITKAVFNMFDIRTKNSFRTIGTEKVDNKQLSTLGGIFFPTLLQKEIHKKYELRIFFLNNSFYAMAIFSQLDEKTQVDYRNYNKQKPNRSVPFDLPDDIKSKLKIFIKKMNLRTGSIDMIVTPQDQFVFLEVNPIGQFGWVSMNCNYFLEEKIALFYKKLTKE